LAQHLTQIDELTRADHSHLLKEDECYFWGEYTARQGFAFSRTNDLIQNFKKPVSRRGRPEYRYKVQSLFEIAQSLREAINPKFLTSATLVPIPPSKCKTDGEYDDRMIQLLKVITDSTTADIRELIVQSESMTAFHSEETKRSPEHLRQCWAIDESLSDPAPQTVALFDDVLTTGCHFRAASDLLLARFPNIRIVGIFIARRVPTATEI
jgi:hypothetical protein